jgi:choline dehydrogenase
MKDARDEEDLEGEALVDAQLRVYGVKTLRIADGSTMPTITTGNIHAPCVIIGERLAEILNA